MDRTAVIKLMDDPDGVDARPVVDKEQRMSFAKRGADIQGRVNLVDSSHQSHISSDQSPTFSEANIRAIAGIASAMASAARNQERAFRMPRL